MKTIGFAGTAKNTGKTTAALHVLGLACEAGFRVALTSIGYDGEAIDNVTGLPKPRYQAPVGTLLATAESCLTSGGGSAGCDVIHHTGIETGLGEVIIARVDRPGLVVLAGPNKRHELERILALLEEAGAELAIADGALNRLVPLLCADGLVLSTGAALEPDIPRLAEHLAALCDLFADKAVRVPCGSAYHLNRELATRIEIVTEDGSVRELAYGSLLGADSLLPLLDAVDRPVRRMTIPGACLPSLLLQLFQERGPLLAGSAAGL